MIGLAGIHRRIILCSVTLYNFLLYDACVDAPL